MYVLISEISDNTLSILLSIYPIKSVLTVLILFDKSSTESYNLVDISEIETLILSILVLIDSLNLVILADNYSLIVLIELSRNLN